MSTTPNGVGAPSPRPSHPHWQIFLPAGAAIALFAAYSIYWYVMAGHVHAAINSFAVAPTNSNIAVSWGSLSMGGYPYRIEADIAVPVIAAPNTPEAWSWQAENLEADLLPYNLHHIVIKADGEQQLVYSDISSNTRRVHSIRFKAEGSWASYVDVKDAPLGQLAIDINKLVALRGSDAAGDKRFAAERLQLHLRPADGVVTRDPGFANAFDYDLALQGENMVLDDRDASAALGANITLFIVQAQLHHMPSKMPPSIVELLQHWRAQGVTLTISDLHLIWGPLEMTAQGELNLDAEGRLQGKLDATIAHYDVLIKALADARIISKDDARVAATAIELYSQFQGGIAGNIKLPVVMNDGKLFLGPMPVGNLDSLY